MDESAQKVTLSFTQKAAFITTAITFFAFRIIGEPKMPMDERVHWATAETTALWDALKASFEAAQTPPTV